MAKKFWTFIGNNKYDIGLTGQTVYVFDKNGNELAKFKDLTYAYFCTISPNNDIFVVKTTDGRMAIYSFEPLKLIKKFRFSKIDGGQDDDMVFSPDGKYLYSLEKHEKSYITALSIYDTADFSLVKRLFKEQTHELNPLRIKLIDFDMNEFFVMGIIFNRESKLAEKHFIAKLIGDKLEQMRFITEYEYLFFSTAKHLQCGGFTEKAFEWSAFRYLCDTTGNNVSLQNLRNSNLSIAEVWKNANQTPIARK